MNCARPDIPFLRELFPKDIFQLHELRPNVKTLFSFPFHIDLEFSIANCVIFYLLNL